MAWLAILPLLFSGAATKVGDSGKGVLAALGGLEAGVLAFLASLLYPPILPLALGTLLGVTLAGKVDKLPHYLNVSSFLFLYAITPVSAPLLPLLLFSAAAYADERFSERKDVLGKRVLLPITVFAYALATGEIPLIAAQLSWDVGYVLTGIAYGARRRRAQAT